MFSRRAGKRVVLKEVGCYKKGRILSNKEFNLFTIESNESPHK